MSNRLFIYLVVFLFFSASFVQAVPYVLVSVAPHKLFVEKIAGDTVQVGLLVPAGTSAHTYEPTPKQMLAASRACIWFRIGEPFETRAIQALKSYNSSLEIVDLRQGLDLIDCAHTSCTCHANTSDLHFWLSARMAQTQADTIAEALSKIYPEHTHLYQTNLKQFKEELKNLDHEIQTILQPIKNRHILVSHPAYAYFCRDYQLIQSCIEFEGKDPTPQQLNKILNFARNSSIHTIFIQMQYNNKGARLIAQTIGAKVVTLDPYAECYFDSMLEIAHAFAEG